MIKKKVQKLNCATIAQNKRVYFDYFIEKEIEAGLLLQGWEVKSLRAGKVSLSDSYVRLRKSEAYLFNATIAPLIGASSHMVCDPIRVRKLLLNKSELESLIGYVNREGYTIIVCSIYWKNAWCKAKIAISKGKKEHDKRNYIKDREWQITKSRLMKHTSR